jgi:hypothetical protein
LTKNKANVRKSEKKYFCPVQKISESVKIPKKIKGWKTDCNVRGYHLFHNKKHDISSS